MDQRSFQFRQNEQGSPFSLTDHLAPGGLPPGSPPDSYGAEEFARSVDMDAFATFPMADHRSFGGFGQAMMLQESQRAGGVALTMHKFIKDPNTPWNPVKLGQGQVNYSDRCFTMPRATTGPSEYGDSAYHSLVDPSVGDLPSVTDFSVINDTGSTFDTRSVVGNLADLQLHNSQSQGHERAAAPPNPPPQDAWSQQRPPSQEPPATLFCTGCNSMVKTKAELNKHKSRHEKPHMCQEPGCSRKLGFGTPNDLLRHQQSVHSADGIKYRCMEGSCGTKPPKDWPRADNFKQHLKRMHQIDLGSDPDLSQYERRYARASVRPRASPAKLDMLSSSPWMGLDQSQSALPGLSDRETSFRQLEDRAMHVSQELHQPQRLQEMEAGQDQDPVNEFTEAQDGSQHEEERPPPLEMDDTILRGLADPQTHAEALTPATSDDSFSLEGGSICPAALTSTPARVSTQDGLGPYQRSDAANRQFQENPRVQDPHMSGQADMDHTGHDSAEFESLSGADEDDSSDTPSEDGAMDGLHAFSESTTSQDESTRHDLEEPNARREEPNAPYRAALPPSKDTANAMDIDQASALVMSLHEKGMLSKILSQLGIQKTKEDEEDNDLKDNLQSPLSTYGREHCPDCEKTFRRPCELKKHRKRHEKPYACTQEDCDKKFGSKNDWKRHENSQHMQLEFWRCTEKASSGRRACAKVCHRRKSFAKHLTQAHGVTDTAALEKRCVDSLNRRNFESLFWCGFCQQAVPFKQDDGQGLSERFDHIDAHFTGKGGRPKTDIGEWKSLETEPPGTFQDILGEPREPEEPMSPLSPLSGKRARDGDADDDEGAASGSRKRRYVKLGPRDALLWICCDCGHYWSPAVTTRCLVGGNCSHSLCSECKLVVQETSDVAKGS